MWEVSHKFVVIVLRIPEVSGKLTLTDLNGNLVHLIFFHFKDWKSTSTVMGLKWRKTPASCCRKRYCSVMTYLFIAELRHFLQNMFINWRVNSPPTVFHSYLWKRAYRPSPNPTAMVVLSNILFCQSIYTTFPCFEAHRWGICPYKCSPSPLPRALFHLHKPSHFAPHLLPPLVHPAMYISILLL